MMKIFGPKNSRILSTLVPGQPSIELVSWYKQFKSYYPTCELQTKRWMVENVKQDWICIDAGANVGYHTILMARLSNEGSVHAFEPTRTFSMLEENVRHSGHSNITLNKLALGSAVPAYSREKLFRTWGAKTQPYFGQWTTVDRYVSSQGVQGLDFLKVAVDGFGLEVLEGASKSISAHRPVVLVEINHALATGHKTASDVFAFMLSMKYQNVLVLDRDNYVFTTQWNVGDPWPRELSLAFDFEDVLDKVEDGLGLEEESAKVSSLLMRPHNNASVKRDVCRASGPAWQYCLEVTGVKIWGHGKAVEVDAEVLSGQLGVFFTDARGKRILDRERVVRSGNSQKIIFPVVPEMARSLMFRKNTGADLEFTLPQIRVGTLVKTINKSSNENTSESEARHVISEAGLDSHRVAKLLSRIEKGGASDLANWLSIAPPSGLVSKSKFSQRNHTMEREDAHYLKWLWASLAPERHFEFGTWEGFGTCLVLKSSKAHVWTLNLAAGEQGVGGAQYTESREPGMKELFLGVNSVTSDATSSVGWMYRSLGLNDRVTQLFGDSLVFDHLFMGKEFFDTVFIDGGHQVEVVSSDQRNAVEMLRPGGVVIWHDYSGDETVLNDHPSCHGVVSAIYKNLEFLESKLDLFWLEGTFLLIGVKKGDSSNRTNVSKS